MLKLFQKGVFGLFSKDRRVSTKFLDLFRGANFNYLFKKAIIFHRKLQDLSSISQIGLNSPEVHT